MNLPYPFDKASSVRFDTHGTINLIDARDKFIALIPMNTAFELSTETEGYCSGDAYGFTYGDGSGSGYCVGYGDGLEDGSGRGKNK
jgi:hypothetical protein